MQDRALRCLELQIRIQTCTEPTKRAAPGGRNRPDRQLRWRRLYNALGAYALRTFPRSANTGRLRASFFSGSVEEEQKTAVRILTEVFCEAAVAGEPVSKAPAAVYGRTPAGAQTTWQRVMAPRKPSRSPSSLARPCSSGKLRGNFGNLEGATIEIKTRGSGSLIRSVIEVLHRDADSVLVRDSGGGFLSVAVGAVFLPVGGLDGPAAIGRGRSYRRKRRTLTP